MNSLNLILILENFLAVWQAGGVAALNDACSECQARGIHDQ